MKIGDLETNTPNYKQRANYGVRVARPGYDAMNCEQNQLVFNSNWPIVQITSVIDLNKNIPEHCVWVKNVVSSGREWVEEEPVGMTYRTHSENHILSVGRNYVWYETSNDGGVDGNGTWWNKITYKKLYHGLGFPPMFYRSEYVSNLSGYLLLTSIDLSKDVDYPYTEGATTFLGSMDDYGIASQSKFNSKVPGLRSDMFSKLVQAIKTDESSDNKQYVVDPQTGDLVYLPLAGSLVWSPLDKLDDFYSGCLMGYEAVVYYGYNNPFGYNDIDIGLDFGRDVEILSGFSTDGPYYIDDGVVRALSNNAGEIESIYGDGVAYTDIGQAFPNVMHSSMVIMRSPMVSPEYEEVIV